MNVNGAPWTVETGECLSVMREIAPETFHSCVCDPPYGLKFMGKDWDHGIPGVPYWAAVLRVLKPGAHLLAFGGTRTFHRLACAIEDAGFEIRDTIMWVYGSGFPKSHDVSKAMDRAAGCVRPRVPGGVSTDRGYNGGFVPGEAISGEAIRWSGYGTALKPAWEPIIVARKPLFGTVAQNCIEHGCGAINVDGCRVRWAGPQDAAAAAAAAAVGFRSSQSAGRTQTVSFGPTQRENVPEWNTESPGRWPANLIHDGSEEVEDGFPSPHGAGYARPDKPGGSYDGSGGIGFGGIGVGHCGFRLGDSGSASRFFYCAKASRGEREAGLREAGRKTLGEYPEDPGKSGSPRARNLHPTVKPVALMRYLCRLVKTPGDTLILDPFMGSGSTGIAALAEGCRFFGIEKKPEYVAIARARIRYANKRQPQMELA